MSGGFTKEKFDEISIFTLSLCTCNGQIVPSRFRGNKLAFPQIQVESCKGRETLHLHNDMLDKETSTHFQSQPAYDNSRR